jgi:uncharacterized membrane protein
MSQIQYLPIPPAFFSILVGLLVVLIVMIQVGILRYAYMRLGMSSAVALLVLVASLVGSYINIPVAQLPGEQVQSGRVVTFFGMRYVVPAVVNWPGTVIAINLGGAVIPVLISLYLLAKNDLWFRGLLAVASVAVVCYWLARPVAGVGIAVPMFIPALSAAVAAWVFSWQHAAPLAYISGSLGTLVGADLLNLGRLQGLGAPVASIGGAGTFDGIFIAGILAVLIAGFPPRAHQPDQHRPAQ